MGKNRPASLKLKTWSFSCPPPLHCEAICYQGSSKTQRPSLWLGVGYCWGNAVSHVLWWRSQFCWLPHNSLAEEFSTQIRWVYTFLCLTTCKSRWGHWLICERPRDLVTGQQLGQTSFHAFVIKSHLETKSQYRDHLAPCADTQLNTAWLGFPLRIYGLHLQYKQ